jgi:hypothetical protein
MASFFLPWFSMDGQSVRGFEIAFWTPRSLLALGAPAGLVLASNSIWAFAFIGVFAFFGLGMEMAALRKRKNPWIVRMLTALAPPAATIFVVMVFIIGAGEFMGEIARSLDSAEAATGVIGVLVILLSLSSWGLWVMTLGMILAGVSVPLHPDRAKTRQTGPVGPLPNTILTGAKP